MIPFIKINPINNISEIWINVNQICVVENHCGIDRPGQLVGWCLIKMVDGTKFQLDGSANYFWEDVRDQLENAGKIIRTQTLTVIE